MSETFRARGWRAPFLLLLLVAGTAWVAQAHGTRPLHDDPPLPLQSRSRIDAVFVLDTTGSMEGLIEGAKRKIWSIASRMATGQPAPEIRVGLVAYRDRGDAYVTRRVELTDDIDAVYAELQGFRAGGGGDGPESVNQALHEAVTRLAWRQEPEVYKVIFLVGDAPPHMNYAGELQYPEIAGLAAQRDIVVNTIQCGEMQGTAAVWKSIARTGGGEYAAIAQNGGMLATATPMDDELAELNRELAATVVPFGAEEAKQELRSKLSRALAAPHEAVAARLSYLDRTGKRANLGRKDLVEAVEAGEVELDAVPARELPSTMQDLDDDERRAFLVTQGTRREVIQGRISGLVEKRDGFLRAAQEKRQAEGRVDSFDERVFETLRSQAAAKGIRYE